MTTGGAANGSDPIAEALIALVASLRHGERLPSERRLASELGVPRSTLRDRLRPMEALGAVRREVGSGTYADGVPSETLSTLLGLGLRGSTMTAASLRALRVALEREAAREAACLRPGNLPVALRGAVDRMEATEVPEELGDADVEFHRALVEASRAPVLSFVHGALRAVLDGTDDARRARIRRLAADVPGARTLHRDIYLAVRAGDAPAAMRAVDRHFDAAAPARDGGGPRA